MIYHSESESCGSVCKSVMHINSIFVLRVLLASKLYWCDVSRDSIDVIDSDGSNRQTLQFLSGFDVKSLYLDEEHQRLYVADTTSS